MYTRLYHTHTPLESNIAHSTHTKHTPSCTAHSTIAHSTQTKNNSQKKKRKLLPLPPFSHSLIPSPACLLLLLLHPIIELCPPSFLCLSVLLGGYIEQHRQG